MILKEVVRVGILISFPGHGCFDCKDQSLLKFVQVKEACGKDAGIPKETK